MTQKYSVQVKQLFASLFAQRTYMLATEGFYDLVANVAGRVCLDMRMFFNYCYFYLHIIQTCPDVWCITEQRWRIKDKSWLRFSMLTLHSIP